MLFLFTLLLQVCGKAFQMFSNLQQHMNMHNKPFKCSYCDVKYAILLSFPTTFPSFFKVFSTLCPYSYLY